MVLPAGLPHIVSPLLYQEEDRVSEKAGEEFLLTAEAVSDEGGRTGQGQERNWTGPRPDLSTSVMTIN